MSELVYRLQEVPDAHQIVMEYLISGAEAHEPDVITDDLLLKTKLWCALDSCPYTSSIIKRFSETGPKCWEFEIGKFLNLFKIHRGHGAILHPLKERDEAYHL